MRRRKLRNLKKLYFLVVQFWNFLTFRKTLIVTRSRRPSLITQLILLMSRSIKIKLLLCDFVEKMTANWYCKLILCLNYVPFLTMFKYLIELRCSAKLKMLQLPWRIRLTSLLLSWKEKKRKSILRGLKEAFLTSCKTSAAEADVVGHEVAEVAEAGVEEVAFEATVEARRAETRC